MLEQLPFGKTEPFAVDELHGSFTHFALKATEKLSPRETGFIGELLYRELGSDVFANKLNHPRQSVSGGQFLEVVKQKVTGIGLHQGGNQFAGGVRRHHLLPVIVVHHHPNQAIEAIAHLRVVQQQEIVVGPLPLRFVGFREIFVEPRHGALHESAADFQGHALRRVIFPGFGKIDVHQLRGGHHDGFSGPEFKGVFRLEVHHLFALNHADYHGVVKLQIEAVRNFPRFEDIQNGMVGIVGRAVLHFRSGTAEDSVLFF